MTTDYINRQEAIRDILDVATLIRDRSKMDTDTVLGILNNLPPANVASVVFCKNCKFYKRDPEVARALDLDEEEFCPLLRMEMPEHGFCWYGRGKQ